MRRIFLYILAILFLSLPVWSKTARPAHHTAHARSRHGSTHVVRTANSHHRGARHGRRSRRGKSHGHRHGHRRGA